jgi:O-antigen ligase
MTLISNTTDRSDTPGGVLDRLATALLAATLIGRIVIPEMPFRTSPLMGIDSGDGIILPPHHIDLAGMTFAVMIVLSGVFWLLGQAMRRRLDIRAGRLGLLIAVFAAWSLISALQADDQRRALVFWTNQAGLMLAGWLAIQLCARSEHRATLLAVLAAAGVMLAVVGLRQVFFDAPERIADFEERSSEIFAARRWTPDSPEAVAFKERLFKAVPLGFFSLANVFASLMIVLGASVLGLAADRWRKVIPARKSVAGHRKAGEIHLPTLSAGLVTVSVPLCIAALVLSLSRGAIGAAAATGLAAAVVLQFRDRLAACWRRWMLATVLVVGVAAGAVIAHGLKHDSLVVKTMTFRWYYWTAGAQIAADNPVWGVGPGGFAPAYEARRRPAAEEAVKTPHNVAVHSIAQYGLPGGVLYLGVLGMVLCGLARPAKGYRPGIEPEQRSGAAAIIWIPLAAVASQCVFAGARGAMLITAVEPAIILAIALAVMLWWGPQFSRAAADGGRITRVVLACGLAGFVAHNTVSFSLWTPGAAIAFWLGAGAVISMTRPAAANLARFRWAAVGCSAAGLVAVIVLLWQPVAARSWATEKTVDSLIAGDASSALAWAEKAADCDPLDHVAAADVAGLLHRGGRKEYLAKARHWAARAIQRAPQTSSNHLLAANIAWTSGSRGPEWLGHMTNAIQRDPQSISMRIRFAERLVSSGMGKRAGEQLRAVKAINNALAPDSIFRLSQAKLARVEALKNYAAELERRPE